MKTIISSMIAMAFLFAISTGVTSCQKKKKGNCYCKFLSGDKTHYDLSSLPRSEQEDSCGVIDNNAEAFAGDCKLK